MNSVLAALFFAGLLIFGVTSAVTAAILRTLPQERLFPPVHIVSLNSLWLLSGIQVYGRLTFAWLVFKRWTGAQRRRNLKTSYSFVYIIMVVGIYAVLARMIDSAVLSFMLETSQLASAWRVSASLISVSFIVIIFLLQYIENEYHNRSVTQDFIGSTYVIPTVYLSITSLALLGGILLFAPTVDGRIVSYWSLLSAITIVGLLTSVGLVYYKITIEIFQNPLDTGLEAKLQTEFANQLKAEAHREVAQSKLSELDVNEETEVYRGTDQPVEGLATKLERTDTSVVTEDKTDGESRTLKRDGVGFSVGYERPDDWTGEFVADINLRRLQAELGPISPYEDHVLVDLSMKVNKYNQNLSIAILDKYRRDRGEIPSYDFPDIPSALTFHPDNVWQYSIQNFMEDFRDLITEAIEDGEISSVTRYRRSVDALAKEVIVNRRKLLYKSDLNIASPDQLGHAAAKELAETYAHMYLKLSATRNYEETKEVHNKIRAQISAALSEGYVELCRQLLQSIEQYYGRHRDEIHHRALEEMNEDIVRILQECVRYREPGELQSRIEYGVWLDAMRMTFRVLLRSLSLEDSPRIYGSLWNELYTRNRLKDQRVKIEDRSDVTSLTWFLSMGYVYECWNQGSMTDVEFAAIAQETARSVNLEFQSLCILYVKASNYLLERNERVEFAAIARDRDDWPTLHGRVSDPEILNAAFVFFGTDFFCDPNGSGERFRESIEDSDIAPLNPLEAHHVESIRSHIKKYNEPEDGHEEAEFNPNKLDDFLANHLPVEMVSEFDSDENMGGEL